ncbi:hypothetical protein C8R46DRAFT_1194733 [Mycena filopes]|nr:hypothetical protein C8R46DRAFT_1194733 [Mycena filopes]
MDLSLPQTSISIAESCPQDVLLEFARHLDFRDLINFLATCRPFRELRLERSLWMAALTRLRTVQMQPLPIAHLDDLHALSRDELERTARRAGRLIQKFRAHQGSEDPPQPVSIRELFFAVHSELSCIEGTNLVFEHAPRADVVRCWDLLTGSCVATLVIPKLQITTLPCTDVRGKVLIGGWIGQAKNWVAITIDYTDRSNITISHVVSPPISREIRDHTPTNTFFITPQLMGSASDFHIATWSMRADTSAQGAVNDSTMQRTISPGHCFAFGSNIYSFHSGSHDGDVCIKRWSIPTASSVSALSSAAPDITPLLMPHPFSAALPQVPHATFKVFVTPPSHGVFAVTHKLFSRTGFLHFWPATTAPANANALAFGDGYYYEHPQRFVRPGIGRSGTYVVVLVQDEDDRDAAGNSWGRLDLLHFSATPVPHVACRRLDTGHVNPWGSQFVILEESLGLVLLVDQGRKVRVLSYL